MVRHSTREMCAAIRSIGIALPTSQVGLISDILEALEEREELLKRLAEMMGSKSDRERPWFSLATYFDPNPYRRRPKFADKAT